MRESEPVGFSLALPDSSLSGMRCNIVNLSDRHDGGEKLLRYLLIAASISRDVVIRRPRLADNPYFLERAFRYG